MLLDKPDKKTEQGWRDYALLLFLYNTEARAEEAASLAIGDISMYKGKKQSFDSDYHREGAKIQKMPPVEKDGRHHLKGDRLMNRCF